MVIAAIFLKLIKLVRTYIKYTSFTKESRGILKDITPGSEKEPDRSVLFNFVSN